MAEGQGPAIGRTCPSACLGVSVSVVPRASARRHASSRGDAEVARHTAGRPRYAAGVAGVAGGFDSVVGVMSPGSGDPVVGTELGPYGA
jgi:hypothetical protein